MGSPAVKRSPLEPDRPIDPTPLKERAGIRKVQRMMEKKASGPGELASFDHVGQYVDGLKNRLRTAFHDTRTNPFSKERVVPARSILVEAQVVLDILRPLVFGFKIAQAPVHIADSVFELAKKVSGLDELVEEKETIVANLGEE